MKKEYLLPLAACVIACVAIIVTLTRRAPAPTSTQPSSTAAHASADIQELTRSVRMLQQTVAHLSNAYADIAAYVDARGHAEDALHMYASAPLGPVDIDAMSGTLTLMDDSLARLESIIDYIGLEDIATNMHMDPTILRDVVLEHAERRYIANQQAQVRELHAAHISYDNEVYGPEVNELYQQARFRGRRNDEERERAYQDLLERYPDSYAAGMILAERAVGNLFRGNTEEAERYYQQLRNHDLHAHTVSEWGVDSVPTVQAFLARRYVREGRYDDAHALLNDMEQNYGDAVVFTFGGGERGRGRGRGEGEVSRTQDIVNDLRTRMQTR